MSEDLTQKLPKSDSDKIAMLITIVQSLREDLRTLTREIKMSLRDVSRGQTVLNDAILKIHIDFHYIDERLHRLEVNRNQQNSST